MIPLKIKDNLCIPLKLSSASEEVNTYFKLHCSIRGVIWETRFLSFFKSQEAC